MFFYDYKSHSNRLAYYRYLSSHVAFSRKMGDFGATLHSHHLSGLYSPHGITFTIFGKRCVYNQGDSD
jgi:hypothetical protein